MTEKTVQLPAPEAMPEQYNAEEVTAAVRQVVEPIQDQVGETQKQLDRIKVPTIPGILPPDYTNVKRLYLSDRGGGVSTPDDFRVKSVERVDGSGLAAGMQRFRIEPILDLNPIFTAPMLDWSFINFVDAWPPSQDGAALIGLQPVWFTCGALLGNIPHDLGRIPEFFYGSRSSGRDGPTGQKVLHKIDSGGDTNLADNTPLVCEFDFIPIFGTEKIDIERMLKSMFSFLITGTDPNSEHQIDDGTGAAKLTTSFMGPSLSENILRDMLTTDKTFGGILVATSWGLPTFGAGAVTRAASGGWDAQSWDQVSGPLRDAVNDVQFMSGAMIYRDISKAAYWAIGNDTENWTELADIHGAGARFRLTEGTIDFTIG